MAGFESLIDFLFHTTHGQMGGQTRLRRVGTDPGQTLEHVARGKFCPICGYFCYISMYCVFGNVATNSFFFFFGGGDVYIKGKLTPKFFESAMIFSDLKFAELFDWHH